MKEAILEALKAEAIREVPIGAVVVHQGQIIGRGYNLRETTLDPLAHAEMIAIKQASEHLGAWRLLDCQLYVTLVRARLCNRGFPRSSTAPLIRRLGVPEHL
jgi:tRNA(adenine34) deaminase